MKILFFIQHLGAGGVLRQLSMLSHHLVRRGHGVSLAAVYPIDEDWRSLWKPDSVEVRSFLPAQPTGVLSAGVQLTRTTSELRRLLRKEGVQVLYCLEGHAARFMAWLATRGLPNTTLIWGIRGSGAAHARSRHDWKVVVPFHLCRWVSPSVPLMISNSEAGGASRMAREYRCRKHLVIPNGFDTEGFRPDPQARSRVRREWAIDDERLVGLVARLVPWKGHRTFLEAAALLARERADVRFVIVGDGSSAYRRELELLSQDLGVKERLVWAGTREDMPAVYNALDVLCSASLGEGFPNVIGEAMACGVPCVVTDVGDSATIVADTGVVVRPGDPLMLANGLATMLSTLDGVNRWQLRQGITDRFGLDRMGEAFERAVTEARGTV